MNHKINSYIGFSVKKKSVVYGIDMIEKRMNNIYLIVYSENLSDNSLKKLKKLCADNNIPLLLVEYLEELLKKNCKVLAITDKNLSVAIQEEFYNCGGNTINAN
ncbi:MAG: ribosomal L7Ae/L30e/S12e/Gadd45 family protein [Clostridia bacterium]